MQWTGVDLHPAAAQKVYPNEHTSNSLCMNTAWPFALVYMTISYLDMRHSNRYRKYMDPSLQAVIYLPRHTAGVGALEMASGISPDIFFVLPYLKHLCSFFSHHPVTT